MVSQILLTLYEYINLIRDHNLRILGCLTMVTEEEGIAGVTVPAAIEGTQVIDAIEATVQGDITNGLR